MLAYIGTYTAGKSRGIYLCRFDPVTGDLGAPQLAAEAERPSFLALHPRRPILYAVGERMAGQGTATPPGSLSAYAMDRRTGALTVLNHQVSGGTGPCHVSVDATGRCALVAHYAGGSVALLPIAADGRLGRPRAVMQHKGSGLDPVRQDRAHAHSILADPANRFALAADLGLDRIFVYRLDPRAGTLRPGPSPWVSIHPGAGPRHFAFHPNGHTVYGTNELDSTVSILSYEARRGRLVEIGTVRTVPVGFSGTDYPSHVVVHPAGRFAYSSNRGHDSIAVFRIDAATGLLLPLGHESTRGAWPRHFAIDPAGRFLLVAHQKSDSIVRFRIDPRTGGLTPIGRAVRVPAPVCVCLVDA